MRFGLMLDNEFLAAPDINAGLEHLITLTEAARDLGFASVFVIHHYLAELPTLQAAPLLGRLSAVAGTMRVGTGVLILPLLPPVHVAEEFATLDRLAPGGAVLGVGAGYREDEFASFGVPLAERPGRLAESVELIRRLWSGEEVTFDGEHYHVTGQRISMKPRRPGGPPIWVGATSPATVLRAAEFADSWVASPGAKTRWAIGNLAAFRERQAQVGRPVASEAPIFREVYVGETDDSWRDDVGESIRRSYGAYVRYDLDYFERRFDELRERSFLFGSAATVAAGVRELAAGGFTEVICRVGWLGTPLDVSLRTLERLAQSVAPLVD